MTEWLPALALLACPVGMGAMMFMMRGKKPSGPDPRELEVVRLRAEMDQLRAELRDGLRDEWPRRPGRSASRPDGYMT